MAKTPAKTQNQQISETYDKIRSSFDDQYIISRYHTQVMNDVGTNPSFRNISKIIPIVKEVDPFVFASFLNTGGASADLGSVFNTFNNAQLSILVPEIRIIVRSRTGNIRQRLSPFRIYNQKCHSGRVLKYPAQPWD